MKRLLIYTLIVFISINCGQQKKKIDYLTTFTKAYGYVKYFHPGDEASAIDWNQFAAYGAAEIQKCKSREDLFETLNALFIPIAPTVKFSDENHVTNFDINQVIPENSNGYCLTYWQHQGVSFGMAEYPLPDSPYESRRAIIKCDSINNQLFDHNPNFEVIFSKSIGSGLYCQMPMVLYRNIEGTYPKADKNLFNELKNNLHSSSKDPKEIFVRLGNIVNTFNVFQHFYPYFDVVEVNWEQELRKALLSSYSDKDGKDHLITLQKFTAPLMDGHINVYGTYNDWFRPKITWEWIENQLIITKVLDQDIKLQVGDVITHINGMRSHKYFEEVNSRISAATDGLLNFRAETTSLLGPENSKIRVKANGKTIKLIRNDANPYSSMYLSNENLKDYEMLDDNTIYINLEINDSKLKDLLPVLEESNAIIFDARGIPNISFEFITHLLPLDDTTQAWMQVPLIVYPDQERIVGFDKYDGRELMKVKEPYFGNKKIVFIIDGRAISTVESFLSYIEGYNLATIIGQPSAGTNGAINLFKLIGGYNIGFTGMKVFKHDGTQHHGIGILPDIYMEKTIKGVKEGRDEFLEKAIEIAGN
ncbi:MAG: S41 family peptidase [Bacteroidales bacterium]